MKNREILELVQSENIEELRRYLASGGDANHIDIEWNCSLIFHAVLVGNLDAVEGLVKAGANVNFKAGEPGENILAETVLSLAMQLRHLKGFESFDPVAKYLIRTDTLESMQQGARNI